MRNWGLCFSLMALSVACAPLPSTKLAAGSRSAAGTPSAAPAKLNNGAATAPIPAGPAPAGTQKSAELGAFVLPRTISLELPAALQKGAGGPAGLIGQDAAGLVGQDGAGVIGQDGAGYRLAQAGAPDKQDLGRSMGLNIDLALGAIGRINGLLAAAVDQKLTPGAVSKLVDPDQKGAELAVNLELKADHALLSVYEGGLADPAKQIISVSFTSPRRGKAVYRSVTPHHLFGDIAYVTTFDLDAGTMTATGECYGTPEDLAVEFSLAGTWQFKRNQPSAANPVAVEFRSAWNPTVKIPQLFPGQKEYLLKDPRYMSANFLADERSALIFGRRPYFGVDQFHWLLSDLMTFTVDGAPAHDHYLDARTREIPSGSAPAELKAIVPADDTLLDVAVESPERGKIGTDAAFAFYN